MSDQIAPTDLPPRLHAVLAEIPGDEQGSRFQLLFFAAATAIDVLVDLDFTRYETDEEAGAEDLWETLAPAVEDTIHSVEAFLECVRTLFGVETPDAEAPEGELEARFAEIESRAVGASAAGARSPERQLEEVGFVVQSLGAGLALEMARFRRSLEELEANPDHWLLLDHIATFRGQFRSGIGAMVYMAARLFLDVTREEVVPAYRDDVENAVLLRRELARLRDGVRKQRTGLEERLGPAELRDLLERVHVELDGFRRSTAYPHLRASDKRPFGESRRQLRELLRAEAPEPRAARDFVEGLTRFLESLSAISRREILMVHDAEAMAAVRRQLRDAEQAGAESALAPVRNALAECERLQGRDEPLDDLCRILRRVRVDQLTPLEILSVVRLIRTALEANPPPEP